MTDLPPNVVILSLQQPSGVFAGDEFGEIDTRFSYIAVQALSLLGQLDKLDVEKVEDQSLRSHSALDAEVSPEERKLVRKLDSRIMPLACILYLFACE